MIGRVEYGRDELVVLSVLQRIEERRNCERLAAGYTVLVTPADADLTQSELLDVGPHLGCSIVLAVVPESVTLDERCAGEPI